MRNHNESPVPSSLGFRIAKHGVQQSGFSPLPMISVTEDSEVADLLIALGFQQSIRSLYGRYGTL